MRVLVTGAAGLIGTLLRREIDSKGIDLKAADGVSVADARNLAALIPHFQGVDAVIDLAGHYRHDTPLEGVYENNIRSNLNAYEAAARSGVKRFIFASSNHVTGLYENDPPWRDIVRGRHEGLNPGEVPKITTQMEIRPDGPYGFGKALGEAAGRYYAEAHGMSVVCLRIGTVNRENRPLDERQYATLLTHADLLRLVRAALEADTRFSICYGVSNNRWRFWDLSDAEALGYRPADNAESFRE